MPLWMWWSTTQPIHLYLHSLFRHILRWRHSLAPSADDRMHCFDRRSPRMFPRILHRTFLHYPIAPHSIAIIHRLRFDHSCWCRWCPNTWFPRLYSHRRHHRRDPLQSNDRRHRIPRIAVRPPIHRRFRFFRSWYFALVNQMKSSREIFDLCIRIGFWMCTQIPGLTNNLHTNISAAHHPLQSKS